MDKVGVFHPGVQHSWQTARALQELNRLKWLATSIFYKPDRWPYKLERLPGPIGRKLHAEFRRFEAPALDPDLVRTSGMMEWLERVATRAGYPKVAQWLDQTGNRGFVKALASEIGSVERFALWGYDNSSLTTFREAKKYGRTCILDRTIGDPRAYNRDMAALQDRYGDWFLERGAQISQQVIEAATQEHALADRILVGCPFAVRTVAEFEPPEIQAKVEVLEYCYDEANYRDVPPPSLRSDGPVRFLFLGLGIPRKGIHHVLEAISQIPESEATLTIVGKLGVPAAMFARYADRVTHIPPVPRADVPRLMAEHDVLLFPSYFEGAGIVLYEALACGMGLIQSDRAAQAVTPDTGILIDRPDTDLLREAMLAAIADRDRVNHWRTSARDEARKYEFSGYRDRIAGLLDRMGI